MAKSFEDLLKKTCSKDVIIDGYRKTMNYLSEFCGIPDLIKSNDIVLPDGFTPKKIYKSSKRRDPSRRWK